MHESVWLNDCFILLMYFVILIIVYFRICRPCTLYRYVCLCHFINCTIPV